MPAIVDIAEETAKHKDEWLLFEVIETSERDAPLKGRLLASFGNRSEIEKEAARYPGRDLQTIFTGDLVPPGMVAIL